jgi:hypothetical protein
MQDHVRIQPCPIRDRRKPLFAPGDAFILIVVAMLAPSLRFTHVHWPMPGSHEDNDNEEGRE